MEWKHFQTHPGQKTRDFLCCSLYRPDMHVNLWYNVEEEMDEGPCMEYDKVASFI